MGGIVGFLVVFLGDVEGMKKKLIGLKVDCGRSGVVMSRDGG